MSDFKLLDVKELGEVIGVPASSVYRLLKTTTIPHIRLGRSFRFDKAKVLAWLENEHVVQAQKAGNK